MERKAQMENQKVLKPGKRAFVLNEEFINSLKSVSIGRKSQNAKSSKKYWMKRRRFLHSKVVDQGKRSKSDLVESLQDTSLNSLERCLLLAEWEWKWSNEKRRKHGKISEFRPTSKGCVRARTPGQLVPKRKFRKFTKGASESTPDDDPHANNCVPGTTQQLPLETTMIKRKKRGRKTVKPETVKRLKTKEAKEFYSVDKILERRRFGGMTEYLIKWEGDYENTWEPESNVTSDLVEEFLARTTSGLKLKLNADSSRTRLIDLHVHPTQFEDKRVGGGGGSGFEKGRILEKVEETFRLEGKECLLVRFRGQAVLEILKKQDIVTRCLLLRTGVGVVLLAGQVSEYCIHELRRFTINIILVLLIHSLLRILVISIFR